MVPKKGYKLEEIEGIVNEGGHEEHLHYSYAIIEEKTGKVVVPQETTSLLSFLINEKLGYPGKMISGSKSGYRNHYPDNMAIFNANLCIDEGKVWHGDIDVTKSKNDLQEIADKTGKKLYVLFEMDGRFDYEEDPLLKNAVAVFVPDSPLQIRKDLQQYYTLL